MSASPSLGFSTVKLAHIRVSFSIKDGLAQPASVVLLSSDSLSFISVSAGTSLFFDYQQALEWP